MFFYDMGCCECFSEGSRGDKVVIISMIKIGEGIWLMLILWV